ncbi:MAG: hybrid sensor histidine kinase/response regulator [Leptospiraceae bacterium]|nr:hybrid sensor histidine kinase/response regulator [Leptospiraceae bacterium]
MNGYDVCKKLKENPKTKDIPIIFLTARSDIESITKGFNLGGVDYITKPFNASELVARIKTHITVQEQKEELIKKNQQLEELTATKEKIFTIIGHDLKGAFSGIIGLGRMLKNYFSEHTKEENEEYLGLLTQTAETGFSLLQNLLQWSRSQTGAINFDPEKLDVSAILSETLSLFHLATQKKELRIKIEIDNNIFVFADKNMIITVFRNLISNAIKFTPQKGSIAIQVIEQSDAIEFRIIDSGVGIKPEKIDQLFKIKSTFSTLGTAGEQGTGIGLILSYEFIQKNNGKIWVESELGKGTSFIFTLPKGN